MADWIEAAWAKEADALSAIIEQAKKAILAASHRPDSQGGCQFKGCSCGAVETFRAESGEFWRLIQMRKLTSAGHPNG